MTRCGMRTSRLHTPSLPGSLMGAAHGSRTALGAGAAPTYSSARPSQHKYLLTSYHLNMHAFICSATAVSTALAM